MRATDEEQVFHTFATLNEWAFDHSGWHPADALLGVNQESEGYPLERVEITTDLTEFCCQDYHRLPDQYYQDPRPRARDYVLRFDPPWSRGAPR